MTYLTVKDVLWGGLLKLDVPHQSNAIWFVWSILIIVIGGNQQLRILREKGKGLQDGKHPQKDMKKKTKKTRETWFILGKSFTVWKSFRPNLRRPVEAGDHTMF